MCYINKTGQREKTTAEVTLEGLFPSRWCGEADAAIGNAVDAELPVMSAWHF